MATGIIKRTTNNYVLGIPFFDRRGWGAVVERNFDIIDAVLGTSGSVSGIVGAWENDTVYAVDDRVVDETDNSIWSCQVGHTSAASGTFATDRSNNPTYWDAVSSGVVVRGAWQDATDYFVGDFVHQSDELLAGIVTTNHTSNTSMRSDIANFGVIADFADDDAKTALGISSFAETLLDDADASAMLSTLGVTAFIKTLLDDADAATAQATLGVSADIFGSDLGKSDSEKSQARKNVGVNDGWAVQPLGVPIPVFSYLSSDNSPPVDQDYRYIILSAGLDGAGEYNEGVLINESVSGSAPLVTATAEISDAESLFNGDIVHLINTEESFLRARDNPNTGVLQNDQMQQITGTLQRVGSNRILFSPGTIGALTSVSGSENALDTGTGTVIAASGNVEFDSADSPNARTGDETRPKNVGVRYFMRIK